MMTLLPLLVIASYSIIHLLEYLSYYARVAGRMAGKPVTGYAIQNATTTVTRFFYLALMPLLGFLVDKQVPTSLYLQMGLAAMFGAALLSLLGYWLRYSWIALLTNAVRKRAGQPPLRVEEIRPPWRHRPACRKNASPCWPQSFSFAIAWAYYFHTFSRWCFTSIEVRFRNCQD